MKNSKAESKPSAKNKALKKYRDKLSNILDRVKIGSTIYLIQRSTDIRRINPNECGNVAFRQHRITLNECDDAEENRNTALHEVLHAIIYVYGLRHFFESDRDTEEQFVGTFTEALLAFMRDNSFLVKDYLMWPVKTASGRNAWRGVGPEDLPKRPK